MPPRTDRLHDFSDAIALVGLRNKQNQISGYLEQGTELKYGSSTIKLESGKVTVTNGTSTVTMEGPTVTVVASNIALTGAVAVTGSFSVNGKDVGDGHKHSGVRSGSDTSGGVV